MVFPLGACNGRKIGFSQLFFFLSLWWEENLQVFAVPQLSNILSLQFLSPPSTSLSALLFCNFAHPLLLWGCLSILHTVYTYSRFNKYQTNTTNGTGRTDPNLSKVSPPERLQTFQLKEKERLHYVLLISRRLQQSLMTSTDELFSCISLLSFLFSLRCQGLLLQTWLLTCQSARTRADSWFFCLLAIEREVKSSVCFRSMAWNSDRDVHCTVSAGQNCGLVTLHSTPSSALTQCLLSYIISLIPRKVTAWVNQQYALVAPNNTVSQPQPSNPSMRRVGDGVTGKWWVICGGHAHYAHYIWQSGVSTLSPPCFWLGSILSYTPAFNLKGNSPECWKVIFMQLIDTALRQFANLLFNSLKTKTNY